MTDENVKDAPQPGDRHVALAGAINCRDLGGLPAAGGMRVRRGLLFRSAELCRAKPEDYLLLDTLGVATIFDLRSDTERAKRPVTLPEGSAIRLLWRAHEHSDADQERARGIAGEGGAAVRAMMIDLYARLPFGQADAIRRLFALVAQDAVPLLFHCAAGKDRTGAAAAVLLGALGVERAAIYEDFVLTDLDYERNRARFLAHAGSDGQDESRLRALLSADPAYLDSLFAALDAFPGGLPGYLRETLGIDATMLAAVRARLLEPAV